MSGIHQEILHVKNLLRLRHDALAKLRKKEVLTRAETMDFEICQEQHFQLAITLDKLLKLEKEQCYAANKANDHSL
jgi:hypothetical protein